MFSLWESAYQPHGTSKGISIPPGKICSSSFLERAFSCDQGPGELAFTLHTDLQLYLTDQGVGNIAHKSWKLKWVKKIDSELKPLLHPDRLGLVPWNLYISQNTAHDGPLVSFSLKNHHSNESKPKFLSNSFFDLITAWILYFTCMNPDSMLEQE